MYPSNPSHPSHPSTTVPGLSSSAASTDFSHDNVPSMVATPYESRTNIQDPQLSHHDPNRPDLSFPFQSTNIEQGGFTDEYRTVTKTGFMNANNALRPIPTHMSSPPLALLDPEKARNLKRTKLVTFVPEDPEDPRNHSNLWKWCKYSCVWPPMIGRILNYIFCLDVTAVCAWSVVEVAFASAVVTGDFKDIMSEFHMGEVVVALSVTLMVCGFGVGPLIWSPLVRHLSLFFRRSIY